MGEMNDKLLAVFLAVILPNLALAQVPQKYRCTYGDLQRRVEILYETGVTVPCEVHYYKDTEAPGERQVLWRALNESGYCERMTEDFIAKLENLGWSCEQGDDSGEDAMPEVEESVQDVEPAEADDTEALIPAEDPEPNEE